MQNQLPDEHGLIEEEKIPERLSPKWPFVIDYDNEIELEPLQEREAVFSPNQRMGRPDDARPVPIEGDVNLEYLADPL